MCDTSLVLLQIILLETAEGQKKQAEKKHEETVHRLRDVEKQLEAARKENSQYLVSQQQCFLAFFNGFKQHSSFMCVRACVCVCACARACVCACVHGCVHACMGAHVCVHVFSELS